MVTCYVSQCIQPARRFLSRILATLANMKDGQWVALTQQFKLDVLWFVRYAEQANGIFYYQPEQHLVEIECDSSMYGGGGTALSYCYSSVYPKEHVQKYPLIHHLEAINLLVA